MAKNTVTSKLTITVEKDSIEHQILEKLKHGNLSVAKSLVVAATNYYFGLLDQETVTPAKALEAANSLTGKSQGILIQNSLPYAATMSLFAPQINQPSPMPMWNWGTYPTSQPNPATPPQTSPPTTSPAKVESKPQATPEVANPEALEAQAIAELESILKTAQSATETKIAFYTDLNQRLKATRPAQESDWSEETWELYDQAFASISNAEKRNIL